MQNAMTVRRIEKLLARISYAAILFGLAVSAFSLAVGLLLPSLYRTDYITGNIAKPVFLPLGLSCILFLALFLLYIARLKHFLGRTIRAYPNAASYFETSSRTSDCAVVCFAVLYIAAWFGFVIASNVCTYIHLDEIMTAGLLCVGLSGFFAASLAVRRYLFSKIRVTCVDDPEQRDVFDAASERKRALIKWAVYWAVMLGVYLFVGFYFKNFSMYAFIPVLAGVNCALRLCINNPFSRYAALRSKRWSVHALNLCSVVLLACFCMNVVSGGADYNNAYVDSLDYSVFSHQSSVAYDRETGVYTVKAKTEKLRILQLTDIHIGASINTVSADRKAFDACYELIKKAKPDLIIVTGDIVYPIPYQTLSNNNLLSIYQFCTFMNNVGIPWAMVYGNHDTEAVAQYDAKSLSGLFRFFRNEPDCPMLYADIQPNVYGRYNQYLRIENADGTLNRLVFLIDSNDYVQGSIVNEYDSVHADQIAWYAETVDCVSEQEGRTVPSFVFMHIPFRAFADAADALERGSEEAVYLFGTNGESVSHPKQDSGFFDVILKKGSTQAVFVGHDHLNNMGVRYRGVDLVYSKSIDYIAYPDIAKRTAQRGATLIVLDADGSYRIEQIDYTG